MSENANNDKATSKPWQFKKGNPGRAKGCLNRTTVLKNGIIDGIILASKRLAESKGTGKGTVGEYVAEMLAAPVSRIAVMKMGTSLVPKELHAEVKVDRVSIVMGPDDDCTKEGE